jgi:ornithine cyclodeaminase/alanine dehydrogenase-like protein (mu-crystallin family)
VTLLLRADDVRAQETPADALAAVRSAFVRLEAGEATVPPIMDFVFAGGEAHVKGAWLRRDPYWAVKAATGSRAWSVGRLARAERRGRAVAAVVMHRGLLIELRRRRADGAVRRSGGRHRGSCGGCARIRSGRHGDRFDRAVDPLRRVGPGTHLTAVGSDMPGKQEISADVVRGADLVVADSPAVARVNGELQHAADVDAVPLGLPPRRRGSDDVTVGDLVGIGVQDAAVASLTVTRALERGIGARI